MKTTIGVLAHVDAGKTSLAETILYKTNSIRTKGNIDNKDTFLDFNNLEKEKGITIYNKQANFVYKDSEYIYIDTPGHTDLTYETNRALNILDCAILILSSIEDIPIDSITKFNNLLNYNIPIIIFVNKMDICKTTKEEIIKNIQNKLSNNCVLYNDIYEHISLESNELLEEYLNTHTINDQVIIKSIENNNTIPIFFGSALKDQGIDELLDFINKYVKINYDESNYLNAYIYKINNEYSYLKIFAGTLHNKDSFGNYKINEIYEVSGNDFKPVSYASAGDIVAVKGLKELAIGTYLPSLNIDDLYEASSLTYRIISSLDTNDLYKKLEPIINEFPELKITQENNNVFINLNGELHQVIVTNLIKERLNIDVKFSEPYIKYRETITNSAYGVGHFEPLRHYAEVIVKLSPSLSHLEVKTKLNNNYINSIVSYLRNYTLRGILTNSPLDYIEIEIVDIKTHPKHTEGGDLIDATRRAIRHALSKINSKLLQPYYLVNIDTNNENLNTIIAYLTSSSYTYSIVENKIICDIPQIEFNKAILNLKSRLKGNLSYSIAEERYGDINNEEEIIALKHYDFKSDKHNPAGSIFCKSGAGHYVDIDEVEANMHLNMSDYVETFSTPTTHNKTKISDEELARVWNSLYKPKPIYKPNSSKQEKEKEYKPGYTKPLIYLIDGYNLMYCIDEELAIADLISAREKVINIVCDFCGYVDAETVLVFDAYLQDGVKPTVIENDNITIVYTKHNQTADTYIENKSKEIQDKYKVIVVTNDNLEQLRVFSNDASIISSNEFLNRYKNFQKNNKHLNSKITNKPLENLRLLLSDD